MTRLAASWTLVSGVCAALLLGAATAQASDATVLADRAGFLIGHAHRCGVDDARLDRLKPALDALITAFASDAGDKENGRAQFAVRALASALAEPLGDPLPSCGIVRSQLAQFEQHQHLVSAQPAKGGREMARDNRSTARPDRPDPLAKPAKAAKRPTTQPEELTADERAALELRAAARKVRGRPPSI